MGSKSNSKSSQATTSKDNSAVVSDQAVNVTDGSQIIDGGLLGAGRDIEFGKQSTISISSLDGGAIENAFNFGEYLADQTYNFAGQFSGSVLSFLEGSRQDDLNALNAGLTANRQLTEKVISTVAGQSEPETTDLSKFTIGALVVTGLAGAYILSRRES
jgi:hypothetical protein